MIIKEMGVEINTDNTMDDIRKYALKQGLEPSEHRISTDRGGFDLNGEGTYTLMIYGNKPNEPPTLIGITKPTQYYGTKYETLWKNHWYTWDLRIGSV